MGRGWAHGCSLRSSFCGVMMHNYCIHWGLCRDSESQGKLWGGDTLSGGDWDKLDACAGWSGVGAVFQAEGLM